MSQLVGLQSGSLTSDVMTPLDQVHKDLEKVQTTLLGKLGDVNACAFGTDEASEQFGKFCTAWVKDETGITVDAIGKTAANTKNAAVSLLAQDESNAGDLDNTPGPR